MSVADPNGSHIPGYQTLPGSPLSLRVRGGPRDGQLVKLTAAKCTIGSSRGCTLRLCGRDVRPVHCLIVRGKANTVVRRWSADTLVNGEPFDDRQLLVGDRLRCGPIEFEIVHESGESVPRQPTPGQPIWSESVAPQTADSGATQIMSQRDGFAPSAVTSFDAAAATGEPTMTVAMSEVRSLFAPSAKGKSASDAAPNAAAEESAQAAAAALAEREAELSRRHSQLESREGQLDQREQEVKQREQAVESRELEIESRSAAVAESHEASPAAGEENDEARRQIDEEREKIERAKRELDAQHAVHAAEHDRWKEDHRQWKAQRQAAENQMEGLHAQVEHQLAEILARRKNLDQDRDAWKTESEQHRRQLEERAVEVARQAEELETWRRDLDAARERAAALIEETSRYEQLCSELADVRHQLAQRDGEIAAAREEVERYTAASARLPVGVAASGAANDSDASRASAEADFAAQRAELERHAEDLLAARSRFERDRAEFDARVREFDAVGEPHAVRTGGGDDAGSSVQGDGGLSGLSTWALLKDKIDFADDEPNDEPNDDAAPPTPRSRSATSPASQAAEPIGSQAIGDDQESIERYMANLMKRVGGKGSEPQSGATNHAPSPASSAPRGGEKRSATSGTIAKPVEERPRPPQRSTKTVTPEEVAAMRELANLNARVAITRHGARQMIPNVIGKAAVSAVSFAAAAAVYLLNLNHDERYLAAAAACALVGALFLARTITSVPQLFVSRRVAPAESESHASTKTGA
ncbi:MAG: FHA domain-containing protein [Pirellulales bacterium]